MCFGVLTRPHVTPKTRSCPKELQGATFVEIKDLEVPFSG